jgi:hypothetical protein
MKSPRVTGGRLTTGAGSRCGGKSGIPIRRPTPTVQRLLGSTQLQHEFLQLHRCGPQPVGFFVAELIDAIGTDSAMLDFVLTWRRHDPEVVAVLAGEFPKPPLRVVPRGAS